MMEHETFDQRGGMTGLSVAAAANAPSRTRDDQSGATEWLVRGIADARRRAQVEADLAYEAWGRDPCPDRYTAYRAAQDAADAITQDLADLMNACSALSDVEGPAATDVSDPSVEQGLLQRLTASLAQLAALYGRHRNEAWPNDLLF